MFKVIKQLFFLLTPIQRKNLYFLQFLVVIVAFTELLGIASIMPFMALVGDINLLKGDGLIADIYLFSGVAEPMDFLFYSGVAVLLMLSCSTVISMLTTWRLSVYGVKIGLEISTRLYNHYMQQDWLFHASGSNAHLTKQVAAETTRVTNGIILPLLQINSKIVLVFFILGSLCVYDPYIAISGLMLFVVTYILLYKLIRKHLGKNGIKMSVINTHRFRLMNEGFGGIKDVLLLNRRHNFVSQFQKTGEELASSLGFNRTMSSVPRYFMELVAFGSMIGLVLFLISTHQGKLGAVLPMLAVYALAAFKLLPALQNIYSSTTMIKSNMAAFESIKYDLEKSLENNTMVNTSALFSKEFITGKGKQLQKEIVLSEVMFTYPNKRSPAVNLTMVIPANKVIGVVGASGSGKSTVIDILLGLLVPQQGMLIVDEQAITENNKRHWQDMIGFVPQSIFLSGGSIAENIAFGLPVEEINVDQVNKAIQLAHLTELVQQLPNGIHTKVGERGVQLSGGQRQRIGIARALYYKANVLIFDEATSALDGITEKIIMEAIHNFNGKKTIVMIAHRLKTVKKCDVIYFMDKGEIVDQGTYQDLINKNFQFREMAENS